MALPVLDGNQSATTLSSVVTGGEHIVAHSVVSLGTTAIANINSAVSGSAVTIPGLARLGNSIASDGTADANLDFIKIGGHQDGQNQVAHIVHVSAGGAMKVDASGSSVTFSQAPVTFGAITGSASILNFPSTQTIAGTVTVGAIVGPAGGSCLKAISPSGDAVRSLLFTKDSGSTYGELSGSGQGIFNLPVYGTVTVGNSITIGSLPAISGTVTANGGNFVFSESEDTSSAKGVLIGFENDASTEFRKVTDAQPLPISISAINNTGGFSGSIPVSGTVTVGNSVTIGSLPAISGTVTANLPTSGAFGGSLQGYNGTNTYLNVGLQNIGGTSLNGASNLPISGTVTVGNSVTISSLPALPAGNNQIGKVQILPDLLNPIYSVVTNGSAIRIYDSNGQDIFVDSDLQAIQATLVTSVTIGNSVTIGSLPAISGTVTANVGSVLGFNEIYLADADNDVRFSSSYPFPISGTVTVGNNNFNIKTVIAQDGSANFTAFNGTQFRLYTPTGASKTLNNIFSSIPSWIVAFSDSVTWFSDSGTQVAYFHDGTQWTLSDFTTPAGTIALDGSVFITNLSSESNINLSNGFTAAQLGSAYVNGSGALRVSLYSSTVTAAAPNGSLTTRFGTPTTANTAFATAAVTKSDRKYLLIQNVTTGSNVITVGIGFTPTTTQGIQLTAGAGITFESSYIPTGAVYVLSSVTASNFTILEA